MHRDFSRSTGTVYQARVATRDTFHHSMAALFIAVAMLFVTAAKAAIPLISGNPPKTIIAGNTYSFTPAASDADGNRLTFSIYNRPVWATFDTNTGRLSGTPTVAQAGTYSTISIRVSDGSTTVLLPAFTITVYASATNSTPTISGTPSTSARVGNAYSFTPSASDADGDRLTFVIYNRPAWATFNTSTGRLSGTPSASHVGTYPTVSIRVTDGRAVRLLPAFTITVSGGTANTPPTISGSPATTVVAGNAYSFKPIASDANGNTLTFNIQNRPAWASFNASTGQLSGAPTATNVGDYANIVVSVSDGIATASLPAFTIAVRQVVNGNATVSWTPPTSNTDGTLLRDLAGYRIQYGNSSGNLNQQTQVASPTATTVLIQNLTPGTYYFAVRAYNTSGAESDQSNIVSKVIQ